MIEVQNICKDYGNFSALKGISFSVDKGEILALLGPNGAGKTTTMKIITGFIPATSGSVRINDQMVGIETQETLGYLPENTPLYQDLSVYEHLEFAAKIHGISGSEVEKAIARVVKACSLQEKLYFQISELSKGYKQRVALAQALIHDPDVLILDEPTTGLDPNQILEIRDLIKELGKKKTIILSTHIMQEVEAIADRVIVINKGQIVAEGTPRELMKGAGTSAFVYRVTVSGAQKTVTGILNKVKSVEKVEKEESLEKGISVFLVHAESDVRKEINKAIINADLDLIEVVEEKQSMENVFAQLTK